MSTHEIRLDAGSLASLQNVFWNRKVAGVPRPLFKNPTAGDHVIFRNAELGEVKAVVTNTSSDYHPNEIAVRAAKEGEF